MSLQIKWKYLQMTAPGVVPMMGPIEKDLRYNFFTTLFGGDEVKSHLKKILGHSINRGELGIPDSR